MKANYKANEEQTYHRDGSVSYFSTYNQVWTRQMASDISDEELAAMTASERTRIINIQEKQND